MFQRKLEIAAATVYRSQMSTHLCCWLVGILIGCFPTTAQSQTGFSGAGQRPPLKVVGKLQTIGVLASSMCGHINGCRQLPEISNGSRILVARLSARQSFRMGRFLSVPTTAMATWLAIPRPPMSAVYFASENQMASSFGSIRRKSCRPVVSMIWQCRESNVRPGWKASGLGLSLTAVKLCVSIHRDPLIGRMMVSLSRTTRSFGQGVTGEVGPASFQGSTQSSSASA